MILAVTQVASRTHLNALHYKECVEKRGLDPQWVLANCFSTTVNEASQRLGYTAYSDGIWLRGCNYQSQFRPDKPWKKEGDKKAPKYRSPLGEYDAMLPTHPNNLHYWDDIDLKQKAYKIDGHPCLVLTEGFFKGIAGCSNDIPTISLLGVEMGLTPKDADPQGKRYLVPTLERYAKAGFGFIIAFDADCATNKDVIIAQRKLAHQLKLFKVPVYSATGLWKVDESCANKNKGMDDYIQNHGGDRFKREVLGRVVDLESWEKQFQKQDHQQHQKGTPKSAVIARELAEQYRHELAWHTGVKVWYRYSAKTLGVWSDLPDEAINAIVIAALESRSDIAGNYSFPFVSHTVNLMKAYLQVHEWQERPKLLPLQDGVLDLTTDRLLPHAAGYRFLWQLPYKWADRITGCHPIQNWLLQAMKGDRSLVEVLRAYLKAVVIGRTDLQRFLECIGSGGSGKGTYTRLAMALVGAENTAVTTLEHLEKNRFETAAIYGKRLLLITDSERYGGEVSVLKAITGSDPVRYERKAVQQNKPFTPTCMVIVAANEPIQSSDYTSGLKRRRLTTPWFNQVEPHQQRDLDAEFKPYLAGLLEWVLTMPDSQMTALVKNTAATVPSLSKWMAESLIDTNPLAEWFDFCVVHESTARTQVGVAKRDKSSSSPHTYQFVDKWLYSSYCEYVTATGGKPVSGKRFSFLLEDLCTNQLKLTNVIRGRDRNGAYFAGLRLRSKTDTNPRPITGMMHCDGNSAERDSNVTAEILACDGCDGYDGKIQIHSKNEKHLENQTEKNISLSNELDSKHPSQSITNTDSNHHTSHHETTAIHHKSLVVEQKTTGRAIATPTPTSDSPIQQGETSQIQAIQPPPPMPITRGWYVGQRVMFWLGVGQRWTEGLLKEVQNDPARKFFKAVVETAHGFVQYIWQESGLMLMPIQEAT